MLCSDEHDVTDSVHNTLKSELIFTNMHAAMLMLEMQASWPFHVSLKDAAI